jgi:hypothetical protein
MKYFDRGTNTLDDFLLSEKVEIGLMSWPKNKWGGGA